MALSIKKGSENYCAQVIKLPAKVAVKGLDNLVQVTYQGNQCLIGKDSDPDIKYLFIPSGAVLSEKFLHENNLFRHSDKNADTSRSGFFDDSGRVKAIKFKGIISTGFIIPQESLKSITTGAGWFEPQLGDSFTDIDKASLCWKYVKPQKAGFNSGNKVSTKLVESIVDSKHFPEHTDTGHLLKNVHNLNLEDYITVSVKLHGTSVRISNSLTHRKLSTIEKVAKFFGAKVKEYEYATLVGSRRVLKSKNFQALNGKQHYYEQDVWTQVSAHYLNGTLNESEAVYGEIIGCDYNGSAIQKGYTYGLTTPKLYIYRITNINSQGIEVDLSWDQMEQRAKELGVEVCPAIYKGSLQDFIMLHKGNALKLSSHDGTTEDIGAYLEDIFYNQLLEKPSVLDSSVVEEGFVLRKDTYPKVSAYKIKARSFLLKESALQDAEVSDLEEEN